jgi:hypothetical protein
MHYQRDNDRITGVAVLGGATREIGGLMIGLQDAMNAKSQ